MWYIAVSTARQLNYYKGVLSKIIRIGMPYFIVDMVFNTSQGWYASPCRMRTITMIAMTNITAWRCIVVK